jgi:hypothetical protein
MNNDIVIVEGVSLSHLNPRNAALKNDYLGNLLSTAFLVLPHVAEFLEFPPVVKRGFLAKSYLFDNSERFDLDEEMMKHGEGLALEITWENWSSESALDVAYSVYNYVKKQAKENVLIRIDQANRTVYFGRGFDVSQIIEVENSNKRTILKD